MTDTELEARLRLAIVLRTSETLCTVYAQGQQADVPYAASFPTPRTERVAPGHLVAIAPAADGAGVVVWRWFDAVVLGTTDGQVSLWEPGHGEVVATPRDPQVAYRPGSRAYASAGLPGADWWVAGLSVAIAQDADVDLAEVDEFCTEHDLWESPT